MQNLSLSEDKMLLVARAMNESEYEKTRDFIIENLAQITLWLNSPKFKDLYENHPYPPLLDPDKVELDSSHHCVALAWDINLPLPKHYKFIFITGHGTGAVAFMKFFNYLCDCFIQTSWRFNDAKTQYFYNFHYLIKDANEALAINISERNQKNYHKFLHLLDPDAKVLVATRDPISLLKHNVGRDWSKVALTQNIKKEFELGDDYSEYLSFLRHNVSELKFEFQRLRDTAYIYSIASHFKNVDFVDVSEIAPQCAAATMQKLAAKFELKTPPMQDALYHMQEFGGYMRYLFPLCLNARGGGIVVRLIFDRIGEQKELKNIGELFTRGEISKQMSVYISDDDFEKLQTNLELFEAVKSYVSEFLEKMQSVNEQSEKDLLKEEGLLNILKNNPHIGLELKKIFDDELVILKQKCPEIIEKWRFYREFEKSF